MTYIHIAEYTFSRRKPHKEKLYSKEKKTGQMMNTIDS